MAYATRMQIPLLQVPTETAWGFPGAGGLHHRGSLAGKSKKAVAATERISCSATSRRTDRRPCADAQAWSGIPGLRPVFEALRPRLVTFRGERGGELFDLPDAPRPDRRLPAPVRLLPEWDNAIVGRADARLLPPQHRSSVFQPGLRVLPTVLVDGVVAGPGRSSGGARPRR